MPRSGWRAWGVDRVIQLERLDSEAITHAVTALKLQPDTTTAAWIDHESVPIRDTWVQRALVSAFWAARLRPRRAVAISVGSVPTSLRVAQKNRAGLPICRWGTDGRPSVWRLMPCDIFVANVRTALDSMPRPTTALGETCRALSDAGRLVVVNPFEQQCL